MGNLPQTKPGVRVCVFPCLCAIQPLHRIHFHLRQISPGDVSRNFRFGPLAWIVWASPALDRTSLPPEQVVVGLMQTAQRESERWTRVSGERAAPGQRDSTVYTTNMATPAANIATVVIATTTHPKRELGWPCISFLSEATTRIATRRKGANNPLITAVQ